MGPDLLLWAGFGDRYPRLFAPGGGIGRVESVVLGAFFIVLVQNGMNIMQIGSYMQMVLLGSLLILAVVIDQLRYKMLIGGR